MPTPNRTRLSVIAAVLGPVAGCSGAGDPTAPVPPPPPPLPITYIYTATVTVDSIKISNLEACDGRDLFGNAAPGAFHYRVAVKAKGDENAVSSSGYGSVLGVAIARGPKGIIGLDAKKFTVSGLEADDQVDIKFSMIEWDGILKDRRLDGQVAIAAEKPGTRGIDFRSPNDLVTGDASTCGGTLYYQLRVIGAPK